MSCPHTEFHKPRYKPPLYKRILMIRHVPECECLKWYEGYSYNDVRRRMFFAAPVPLNLIYIAVRELSYLLRWPSKSLIWSRIAYAPKASIECFHAGRAKMKEMIG